MLLAFSLCIKCVDYLCKKKGKISSYERDNVKVITSGYSLQVWTCSYLNQWKFHCRLQWMQDQVLNSFWKWIRCVLNRLSCLWKSVSKLLLETNQLDIGVHFMKKNSTILCKMKGNALIYWLFIYSKRLSYIWDCQITLFYLLKHVGLNRMLMWLCIWIASALWRIVVY